MNQIKSDWISVGDASKILGVTGNTVKKLIRQGTLPAFTIQGVTGYRLRRHDVEALIHPAIVESPKNKKGSKKTLRSATKSR